MDRNTKQMGLVERAKRIETIRQSLREARDSVEVAVGQLCYLSERGTSSDKIELEDTETKINDELDWLELMATQQMGYLTQLVAQTDSREVHELADNDAVCQAERILEGREDG